MVKKLILYFSLFVLFFTAQNYASETFATLSSAIIRCDTQTIGKIVAQRAHLTADELNLLVNDAHRVRELTWHGTTNQLQSTIVSSKRMYDTTKKQLSNKHPYDIYQASEINLLNQIAGIRAAQKAVEEQIKKEYIMSHILYLYWQNNAHVK